MKKISIIIFLLSLANLTFAQDFRKTAPAAGPAPKIEIGSYQTTTLPNGLQVIVVENHKLPRVSVQLTVDAPPIFQKDAAGYVDIAGEMLMRGTKSKTKAQIDEEVDFMGATLNSSAGGLYGASLRKHTEKLIGIMADVLLNPAFSADEFEKVKKQTINNLQQEKDDANSISGNVAAVLNYGTAHPYGEITTERSIANVQLPQCISYYNTYFKPNISYLVIVGDITNAQAQDMAKKYFGSWVKGEIPKSAFSAPKPQANKTLDFVNKQGGVQAVINVTYPIDLKPNSPDVIKTRVMTTLLGGYFRSRINNNLRESKGYTYGAGCSIQPDIYSASFSTSGSYRNVVADSALTNLLYEIDLVTKEKAGDKEVEMVKNVMSGNFARSLEDPQTVARFALNIARYGLDKNYYNNYLSEISKVNADDILAMAKKYINLKSAHMLVVGNKDIADRFKSFTTDGKINFYDLYGNPVQTNNSIPDGMTADKVLADYINAIGGKDKISKIKELEKVATMEMQGMKLTLSEYQKTPGKYLQTMGMNGMVMQSMVCDGTKAAVIGGGQTQNLEGSDFEDMKSQAVMFPEAEYATMGCKTELKGIEDVDGSNAYQILVTWPNGKTASYFYDVKSSLKVRALETQGEGEQAVTITTSYKDYKEVDGVKFPFTTIMIGMMGPMPMEAKTESIKINGGIDDSKFMVK